MFASVFVNVNLGMCSLSHYLLDKLYQKPCILGRLYYNITHWADYTETLHSFTYDSSRSIHLAHFMSRNKHSQNRALRNKSF